MHSKIRNLQLAKEAQEKARNLVLFSTNRRMKEVTYRQFFLLEKMVRSKIPNYLKEQVKKWHLDPEYNNLENKDYDVNKIEIYNDNGDLTCVKFGNYLKRLTKRFFDRKDDINEHKDNSLRTEFHTIENLARSAIEYRVGNCLELSCIAFCYLLEQTDYVDEKIRIEIIGIGGYTDHVFVIIDRDEFSDIHNPSTWGENVVICDAWDNCVIDVTEQESLPLEEKMPIYKKIVRGLGRDNIQYLGESIVGSGHSERWNNAFSERNKLRVNIKDCADYQFQDETLPFETPLQN